MARVVVTVGINATRIAVHSDANDTPELFEEVSTEADYAKWLVAVAAKLTEIRDNSSTAMRVMLIVPGTLDTETRLVGISRGMDDWQGKQPQVELHALLNVPVHVMEAGVALLACEQANTMFPPQIAIAWGAGITAANTLDSTQLNPIAAGHLPGPHNTGRCACGGTDCINLALAGRALQRRLFGLELERHEWSAQMETFLRFVVTPLAIAASCRVLVIGGEVIDNAIAQGFPVKETVAKWLNHYVAFAGKFVVYDPSSRTPFVDGALQFMPPA